MIYREISPGPRLSPWVRCFWFLHAPPAAEQQPILPDGCLELVVHLGSPFAELRDDRLTRQPAHLVVGQMTCPVTVAPTGGVDVVGVRFRPAGARMLLEGSLHELTGRVWALEDVAPRLARTLPARLEELTTDAARATAFEEEILRHRSARGRTDGRISAAVAAIEQAPAVDVTDLAARFGTSVRQLERGFAREVGLPPRLLARLVRFQRAVRARERVPAGLTWAAVAARCGYADQAHLIRDWRKFAGEAPARFAARKHVLAERMAGAESPGGQERLGEDPLGA